MVPVVYLDIPKLQQEQELNIRLNKNTGEFDLSLFTAFPEAFLDDIGFSSESLDTIFEPDTSPDHFDLQKELKKMDIKSVRAKEGDVYELGESRLMVSDSTNSEHILTLLIDTA